MDGAVGNDDSQSPSMSSDGRYIAFSSRLRICSPKCPKIPDIFARYVLGCTDPLYSATQLVSTDGMAR